MAVMTIGCAVVKCNL